MNEFVKQIYFTQQQSYHMLQQIRVKSSSVELKFCNEQSITNKIALKTKTFGFGRSRSMKFQKTHKGFRETNSTVQSDQKIFVPRLKSKQLICSPKIFFSVQRKKLKAENSQPSFNQIRFCNPQMKGFKIKRQSYIFTNKNSLLDKRQIQGKTSVLERKNSYQSNQSWGMNDCQKKNTSPNKFTLKSYGKCNSPQNRTFLSGINVLQNLQNFQQKKDKRPKVQQSLSFIIKRKRQMKNRTALNKINCSKHYISTAFQETN